MDHFCYNCWHYTGRIVAGVVGCADDRCVNWLCRACSTPAPVLRREHREEPRRWDFMAHRGRDPETGLPMDGFALQYTGGPSFLCVECSPPTEEAYDAVEQAQATMGADDLCPFCGSTDTVRERMGLIEHITVQDSLGLTYTAEARSVHQVRRCRRCVEAGEQTKGDNDESDT